LWFFQWQVVKNGLFLSRSAAVWLSRPACAVRPEFAIIMAFAFYENLGRFGEATALTDTGGHRMSYAALHRAAADFACKLGDVRRLVFLEASNRIETVTAYLGCLMGGHPVHPFSGLETGKVGTLIDTYRPNAVVRFAGAGPVVEWLHREAVALHPELCLLLSTSGTTGSTKFVKLTRRNICSNATAIAGYLGLGPSERAMTALKFHYSYGLSVVNSHLECGGSLLMSESSVTLPDFWQAFRDGGATSFAGVPFSFEALARMNFDFSSLPDLRYATQAGGRLSPALVRRFAQEFAALGKRFFVMYGQTEAAPRIAYLPPNRAADHPGCIGIAIPGGEISLVDGEGGTVAVADSPGELIYRGPNVMMGYAENAADLASDESPPLLRTGDIACRNAEGLYYIVGRSARFVKMFGARVNLDEVEADVRARDQETAVTGDDSRIVIAVRRTGALDRAAVFAALAGRYHLPTNVFAVAVFDVIPRLLNGKTDYRAILAAAPPFRGAPAAKSP
jgi:acyl-CoA synthetase (AMP-forming)/AMP-acid ligase II